MKAVTPAIPDEELKKYRWVAELNGNAVMRFGGRLAVLLAFVDAALPELSGPQ